MRTITIFFDESGYTFTWLKTLIWAKSNFLKKGFKIVFANKSNYRINRFSHKLDENYYKKEFSKNYDIIFLAFHHSSSNFFKINSKSRLELLKLIKSNSNLLVWLDTADSPGNTQFNIIDIVDFYLKKQLYVDKSLYFRPIWGSRLFCEYYHNKTQLNDESLSQESNYHLINEADLKKIRLSWNVGLGDLFTKNKYLKFIFQNHLIKPKSITKQKSSTYDVHYRGSHKFPIVHYQRFLTVSLLDKYNKEFSFPDFNNKVSFNTYIKEVNNSKAIISPFGWGEICTRDFEAFAYDSFLLKPNMTHLDTFPQFFIPNITYIPIDWDFTNFYDVLKKVKNNLINDNIKHNAKALLSYYRSNEGKEIFTNHILKNINLK